MRFLAILFVAVFVVGANAQLSDAAKKAIETTTKAIDDLCKSTIGPAINALLGANKDQAVCNLSNAIKTFTSPGDTCKDVTGNPNSVKVVLALAENCTLKAGCNGQQTGTLNDVTNLLQCVLKAKNNSPLQIVGQLLKNIFGGLSKLKDTISIVQFIVYILLTKVNALLCSPSFSLFGILLVLPVAVSIILYGAAIGLALSALGPVGLIVLALTPVVLILVFTLSSLLVGLAPGLDTLLVQVRALLSGIIADALLGDKMKACTADMITKKLSLDDVKALIKPVNPADIGKILSTILPVILTVLAPKPPTFNFPTIG